MRLTPVLIGIVVVFLGCSSDPKNLTRERAAALIKPQLVDIQPSIRGRTGMIADWALANEDRALVFIGLERTTSVNNPYVGREQVLSLTSKGRERATAEKWHQSALAGVVAWVIPLGTYQFDSITGIQQSDKTHALVTFSYDTIPNDTAKRILAIGHADLVHAESPLAALQNAPGSQAQQVQANATLLVQAMGVNSNPTFEDVFKKTNTATVPLTLYDDGWRVGQ